MSHLYLGVLFLCNVDNAILSSNSKIGFCHIEQCKLAHIQCLELPYAVRGTNSCMDRVPTNWVTCDNLTK